MTNNTNSDKKAYIPDVEKSAWFLDDKKQVPVAFTNLKYLQCISFSSKQAFAQLSSV